MDADAAAAPSGHDIADAMPHIVWTHDGDGEVLYFNAAWVQYTGHDLDATRAKGAASFVHPSDRDSVLRLFVESRLTGKALEATYRLRDKDGAYRWHQARVAPLRHAGGRVTVWVGTAFDIEEQRRSDLERAFLADAGRVLGASLDVKRTLNDVARLLVPELADWCSIDLLDDAGTLQRAAVAHVDPAKVDLAWELWRKLPPRRDAPNGPYVVIRDRRTEWFAEIPDRLLVESIPDPEILELIRGLGLRSGMTVPLVGREGVLGVIALVSAESGRRYTARDVGFGEEVARRVAVALENARLYSAVVEARTAAEALAADVIAQSQETRVVLETMRAERDEAVARATRSGGGSGA